MGLSVLIALASSSARASLASEKELRVRAALLLSFAKFTTWPERPASRAADEMRFCLLEPGSFTEVLRESLLRRTVNGRATAVLVTSASKAAGVCDVLFVAPHRAEATDASLSSLAGSNVLTVGAFDGFLERGGMINIVHSGRQLGFEVNRLALERSGLKPSARLLRLADRVLDRVED